VRQRRRASLCDASFAARRGARAGSVRQSVGAPIRNLPLTVERPASINVMRHVKTGLDPNNALDRGKVL
jgi:hypothetical protein